ncbi:hypothetical protein C9374_007769 [Naegleria lovaniensis]|uniref:Uncharacterized protein n=1 Tax=Naegleria lovaniensis TaxID=51637 RepID=A0AA88GMH8_NAELO|nr:uncharacterized protein C9374_007769 [Naegleria lovaniensis]KAG2379131.1 hypothetical protein C9374_007769 [Naegleria lovaniensis]
MTESLLTVVNTLDTYFTVMSAELEQINLDIDLIHTFIKRYGNRYWEASLQKLNRIKKQKENILRDVKLQIELFNIHVESGRELCNRLERINPIIVRPKDEDLMDDQLKQASGKNMSDAARKVDFQPQRKFLRDGSVLINDNVREIGIASSILAYSNSIDVSSGDEDVGPKRRVNVPLASVITPSTQRSVNNNKSSLSSNGGALGASVLNTPMSLNNISPAEIPSSSTATAVHTSGTGTTFHGKTKKKKKKAQQPPAQTSKKLSEGEQVLRKDTILTDTSSSTDEEDTFDMD